MKNHRDRGVGGKYKQRGFIYISLYIIYISLYIKYISPVLFPIATLPGFGPTIPSSSNAPKTSFCGDPTHPATPPLKSQKTLSSKITDSPRHYGNTTACVSI